MLETIFIQDKITTFALKRSKEYEGGGAKQLHSTILYDTFVAVNDFLCTTRKDRHILTYPISVGSFPIHTGIYEYVQFEFASDLKMADFQI